MTNNLMNDINSTINNMRSTIEQAQATLDKLHAFSAELDIELDALAAERDRCEKDLTVPVDEFDKADLKFNAALENLRNIEKEQKIFQDYIDSAKHILWRYNSLWGLE